MKEYKCHKVVKAAKIVSVENGKDGVFLHFEDGKAEVSAAHFSHMLASSSGDLIGGYFVQYENNYTSWSPSDVFEAGYSEIERSTIDEAIRSPAAVMWLSSEEVTTLKEALRQYMDMCEEEIDMDGWESLTEKIKAL